MVEADRTSSHAAHHPGVPFRLVCVLCQPQPLELFDECPRERKIQATSSSSLDLARDSAHLVVSAVEVVSLPEEVWMELRAAEIRVSQYLEVSAYPEEFAHLHHQPPPYSYGLHFVLQHGGATAREHGLAAANLVVTKLPMVGCTWVAVVALEILESCSSMAAAEATKEGDLQVLVRQLVQQLAGCLESAGAWTTEAEEELTCREEVVMVPTEARLLARPRAVGCPCTLEEPWVEQEVLDSSSGTVWQTRARSFAAPFS